MSWDVLGRPGTVSGGRRSWGGKRPCGIAGEARAPRGVEYKIKCAVPADDDPSALFRKLPSPIARKAMAEIYHDSIEADGFCFMDHLVDGRVAAVALKRFIDEALRLSPSVEVTEPGRTAGR